MISGSMERKLRLWNEYVNETVIDEVKYIDKDRVIVGAYDKFKIVNTDKCVIEKKIRKETPSLSTVCCFIKFRDNNTIICGCIDGLYYFYDMNIEKYKTIKELNHDKAITALLTIDDYTFLFYSENKTIKLWKY